MTFSLEAGRRWVRRRRYPVNAGATATGVATGDGVGSGVGVGVEPQAPIVPIPPGSSNSVNHIFWPGPATMRLGDALDLSPAVNSVITPAVVMRPTSARVPSVVDVNQRFPSQPGAMSSKETPALSPALNSV